ncbi:MAG: DtxR family transcriptional regulator [bacterium]
MEYCLSESLEDYLVDIFEEFSKGNVVRIKDIARKRGVKLPSVVSAIKALTEKHILNHERYGYVMLTDYGFELARNLFERKKTLLYFLINTLDVPEHVALNDAHKMEHGLSKETLESLIYLTNFMKQSTIGDEFKQFKASQKGKNNPVEITLKDLKVGEYAKIKEIKQGTIKSRLLSMGTVPGTEVKIERIAPLGDPIDVLIRGYHLSLRKEEAEDIIVERI